jgi:hypothetical protein
MATKEAIAKMTTQEKLNALPRALAKTMKKYLNGEKVDVRISLEIPKLDKDGKPLANFQQELRDAENDEDLEEIDVKNNVYKRKSSSGERIRSMMSELGIDTEEVVKQLEKALESMPDSENKRKTQRMFAIRKELQALEDKRKVLLDELQAL